MEPPLLLPRRPAAPTRAPAREDLARRVVQVTMELLAAMGVEGSVLCRDRRTDETPHLWVEILARDSRFLIGERGSSLAALEHVLRRVLRPVVGDEVRIIADVNAYRVRRIEFLRRRAREAANRASRTGRAVLLDPMNAAERRIVHVTLAAIVGVTTESQGEEPERRVIVRPKDPLA